jgi:homocysteine S-methyltransferase
MARAVKGLRPSPAAAPAAAVRRPKAVLTTPPKPVPEAPGGWPDRGRFVVAAGVRAPGGQDIPQFIAHAAGLVSSGADLLAIVGQETSARVSPVAAAAVLRERAGADVMVDIETAGRSLAALQADLLGGYALGVQTVVCRTGTPWAAGDYPDPHWIGDVDSVRLIAALAGLNEGADWRGVPAPDRTRFVVGACVHTAAADTSHELTRSGEKAQAGAHFLVTDVIYDLDVALRLLTGLREHGIDLPVLAVFAPFSDPKTVMRLIHEVPGAAQPSEGEATRASADPVSAMLDSVGRLRGLIAGVLIHPPAEPDDRMASLVGELAALRRAS